MSDVEVLEMETSPETANYRQSRLKLWQKLADAYLDYVEDAERAGAGPTEARKAAGKHVRGEVRTLLTELLTRASTEAVVAFLRRGVDWADKTESLLHAGDAVPELIAHAYPRATWARHISTLEKKVAEDNASWSGWCRSWMDALGKAVPNLQGTADAAAKIGNSLADALRYLPLVLGGVAAAGLGVVAVVLTRR